ncbi:MAG: lycopene cyclase domain-containing protein [Proteobacteria bacterium]|nr:lycopene cyclase domain-containing protein [Pseudomonadota bacterium]
MKEYTLLACLSVVVTILLDSISGVRVLRRRIYYIFFAVIICFKLFVNGYLTSWIVMYNPRHFLGYRIGTIPLEDFLFGFSMVTMSIIFWEYFKTGSSPGQTKGRHQ